MDFKRDTSFNIFQRINAVMEEVNYIQKSEKKVDHLYRFVSHDQVTAAMHTPMTKHGIAVITSIIEMSQDGNRTTCKIEVAFVNIDKPEDKFSVIYYGYGIDKMDKGPGKAISYAFKYALLKTFCLETGDDPDNDQNTKFDPGKKPDAPLIEAPDLTDRLNAFFWKFPGERVELIDEYFIKCSKKGKISRTDLLKRYEDHDLFLREFGPYRDAQLEKEKKPNNNT